MTKTTALLDRPAESKPPSDNRLQLANPLQTLCNLQTWTDCSEWRAQLSHHHAEVNNYRNLLSALRDPDRVQEIGWQRSMMRRYGTAWPTIGSIETLVQQEEKAASEVSNLLGELQSKYGEAETLLRQTSPKLGGDFLLWERIVTLKPMVAAQRFRKILGSFLLHIQNGSQHGDNPDETPDKKTDTPKESSRNTLPESQLLRAFIRRVNQKATHVTKKALALELCNGDEQRALSLLRQERRFRQQSSSQDS